MKFRSTSVDYIRDLELRKPSSIKSRGHHGCDRMVVGFTTTCAISAYQLGDEPRSWQGVLDTTLCEKNCQLLATGQWFSPGTLVSLHQ